MGERSKIRRLGRPGVNIKGETVIARPVEVVFDFVADHCNEPVYNPWLVYSEKVTDGPIGVGTRFTSSIRSRRRPLTTVIEYTDHDRPRLLASRTVMTSTQIRGTLAFQPVPAGTRMRWTWQVEPTGLRRLLIPVIARLGERQERRTWSGLKRYLEMSRPPAPGRRWERWPGPPGTPRSGVGSP